MRTCKFAFVGKEDAAMYELTRVLYKTWKSALSKCDSRIEDVQTVIKNALYDKIGSLELDVTETLQAVSSYLDGRIESAEKITAESRKVVDNAVSITLVALVIYAAQRFLFDEDILAKLGADILVKVVFSLIDLVAMYLAAHFIAVAIFSHVVIPSLGMSLIGAEQFKSCVDYILLCHSASVAASSARVLPPEESQSEKTTCGGIDL